MTDPEKVTHVAKAPTVNFSEFFDDKSDDSELVNENETPPSRI
jgi:hypothetical protein